MRVALIHVNYGRDDVVATDFLIQKLNRALEVLSGVFGRALFEELRAGCDERVDEQHAVLSHLTTGVIDAAKDFVSVLRLWFYDAIILL